MFIKKLFEYFLVICVCSLYFGAFIPLLISANSDWLVCLGFFLVGCGMISVIIYLKHNVIKIFFKSKGGFDGTKSN